MVVLVFPAYWSLGEYLSVFLWTLHWAEMPGKWLLAGNRATRDMRLWEHALAYVVPVMFLGVPSYVLLARRAVSRWRVVLSALGWSFFTVQILGTVPMAWVWWCEDHPPARSTGMEELTVVFPFVLSLVGLVLLAVSIVMYAVRTRDKTVLWKVWLGKDLLSRSEYLLNRAGLGLAVGGIVLLVLLRLFSGL
jgi:hypothetical protein